MDKILKTTENADTESAPDDTITPADSDDEAFAPAPSAAITLENVSLRYKNAQVGFRFGAKDRKVSRKELARFQALRDISFSVNEGEILGIIGQNGSGKSSLLRILSGTVIPDEGTVTVAEGKSRSLLSLGGSLVPDLSGAENIHLIGLQRGFSKQQIDEVYDQIIEFAGLGDSIRMPIRTYSTGMMSKLKFSVAVHLTTDILLIDEIFSVGDMAFRQKSNMKMMDLIKDSRHTVVIVSHGIDQLRRLCDRILWMDQGRIRMLADPEAVATEYLEANYIPIEKSPLKRPGLRTVVPVDGTKLKVTWNSTDGATGYLIYRHSGDKKYKMIKNILGQTSDTYIDEAVEPGIIYTYTVRAYRWHNGELDRSRVFAGGISNQGW